MQTTVGAKDAREADAFAMGAVVKFDSVSAGAPKAFDLGCSENICMVRLGFR